MSNEFYSYVADNIVKFFQEKEATMRPGERYCLKLDTEEMVERIDQALKEITALNNIQGAFDYEGIYSTYTIKLSDGLEVVVASRIRGMTDDFLATLRNAKLSSRCFPILMLTHSSIDTITSGTGDLSAKGMPFHATSIISKIKYNICHAQLSVAERVLLETELERKQSDRFSDKSSLFEYSDLLTVLKREYVQESDYPLFLLLPDPESINQTDEKKIRLRLEDNHEIFERIDRVVKHGDISDELEKEFDKSLIDHLERTKKKNIPWYEGYTYVKIKSSQDKLKKKLSNPLEIKDTDFNVYSGTPLEYTFFPDEKFFMRDDGTSKAKSRRKNILIFNPDHRDKVTIVINTNIALKENEIKANGCVVSVAAKEVRTDLTPMGCSFARLEINDKNITYVIRICIIDVRPQYLETIRTAYRFNTRKNLKRSIIQICGESRSLTVNPGNDNIQEALAVNGGVYSCEYNQTLKLTWDEEAVDTDTGHLDCALKCGSVVIPIQIQDEPSRPVELTGVGVFKWKYREKKSLEYRSESGRIVSGTTEFFTKDAFRNVLVRENLFVENEWAAIEETPEGIKEYKLSLPEEIYSAYVRLLRAFKRKRSLPSLAYYSDEILDAARQYVKTVENKFSSVRAGDPLEKEENDILLLGCLVRKFDEQTIVMSPLHPLNVLYQINLINEKSVGEVRDNLIGKLTTLYLIPFIKSPEKKLYQAIEQRDAPEWRKYVPFSDKRYQGARKFVQKLVCDKISQYKEHFSFLFDDIGNNKFYINLVNMGDCQEIFQGLLRFYARNLKTEPENLLDFVINIYAKSGMYNVFFLLSDQRRLKEYIKRQCGNEDASELALMVTGKVRCYFRDPDELEYQYAHLTFYEMNSAEDTGTGRMDSITTGISLQALTSGTPSVLHAEWYKTGFGMKHAERNRLTCLAAQYNALHRVAFSGSSYEPESCIFTEIEQGQEGQLGKIYASSNWVVFVNPKVDLSFFQRNNSEDSELMIIHYSDQCSSSSGYDDITVTQKSDQYNEIISEQLQKKGVTADLTNINEIISLFNAINGGWMLRLITAKKLTGAADSHFSREKMSILSAIKVCMAYYSHQDIVWIPVSLEEMLRVSGGAGLSQKEGLLSARNLGFEQGGATSDDILLVGIEGPVNHIKIYIHPVEVKIGQNPPAVLSKANAQVHSTYEGLWNSLWPDLGRDELERKLSRNFFIQLLLVCCEKLKLYRVYPQESWDDVLEEYRENLLNEKYEFSHAMDSLIGKGTIVAFGADILNMRGEMSGDVCLLEFPEKMGSSFMVLSAEKIEKELVANAKELPKRLKETYVLPNIMREERSSALKEESADYSETLGCETVEPLTGEDEHTAPVSPIPAPEDPPMTGMRVLFGTDVESGEQIYWYPNDTNQLFHTNTGIIGTMGTGKTQFTKSLITQLFRDQKNNIGGDSPGILIFDYKGDYNESKDDFVRATGARIFKPYHLPFNPLALIKSKAFKPLLPVHTANTFKDTLTKVYGLGPKQQNTLFQCIIDAYAAKGIIAGNPSTWDNTPPTFDTVYSLYYNDYAIKKTDSLAAVMDKLYQFEVFEKNPRETKALFDLLKGVVVVDLSGYDADIQSLIVAITLDLFYSQMQAAGSSKLDGQYRQLTKLILVDEADNFMSEGFPSLKKILKEGREFGVGTILSTQSLDHFGTGDDDYSKYILTWVVHNVTDLKNADVEFVFKTEPRGQEGQRLYNDIKALKKHYSIVKIGNAKPGYIIDKAFWELYKELNLD